MKNNVIFKITVISVLMFIGCEFKSYGLQFALDDMSGAAQSERHNAVYDLANKYLKSARLLESKGIQYRSKDYLIAIHTLDSLSKLYSVSMPINVVSNLKLIMFKGEKFIPEDLKDEFVEESSKYNKTNQSINLADIFGLIKFILFVAISYLLLWIVSRRDLVLEKFICFVKSIRIEIIKQKQTLTISSIDFEVKFYYQIRPPNSVASVIDHVPWIVSL